MKYLLLCTDIHIAGLKRHLFPHSRIATSLGAFQELGSIRFQVMKDLMFIDPNAKMDTYDSDEEIDHDLFSRVINAPAKTLVMGGLCFCFALSGMALSLAVGWHFHKQKGSM